MNIGQFRHTITIQRAEVTVDAEGARRQSWQNLHTVKAKAADVSGRDFYAAAAMQMEDIITFTLRYLQDLRPEDRILFDGGVYDIVQINHLGYKRDFLTVKARQRRAKEA